MTDVVASVLSSVGYLLIYVGVFVLLVNIGAAIKAISGGETGKEPEQPSPY
ncbi:MAG: hypothetical protein JRG97_14530 [Deltaproteobacteria bacterium]|nr:hypothetical protein [Deltaproteobacteria bacterium]MBW2053668.1 hypothetical protein [Deltaproteobacteria bacterium]MBW2142258.1 hypothetical protein [Deltaproteobacteria bacterium]MBW2324362.1 hypothetical protein [Deltaproteobacteria bacterium]